MVTMKLGFVEFFKVAIQKNGRWCGFVFSSVKGGLTVASSTCGSLGFHFGTGAVIGKLEKNLRGKEKRGVGGVWEMLWFRGSEKVNFGSQ